MPKAALPLLASQAPELGDLTGWAVELGKTVSPPSNTSLRYMMMVAMRSLPSCGCHQSSNQSVCASAQAHLSERAYMQGSPSGSERPACPAA